jgi:hypothetical protein
MARVPILNKRGDVIAWSLVDEDDVAYLNQWRWYLMPAGYAWRSYDRRPLYMHRQLLGLARGDRRQVDHINRQPLDNRRSNLRIVTPAQNGQNQRGKGGTSRFRGVSWDTERQKWLAMAKVGDLKVNLGRFESEQEAARVASAWRREHMPFSNEGDTP